MDLLKTTPVKQDWKRGLSFLQRSCGRVCCCKGMPLRAPWAPSAHQDTMDNNQGDLVSNHSLFDKVRCSLIRRGVLK